MSKQDVKKYFEMLLTNEEFTKKIIETGEDKEAKMKVVREHGLNFSKDEFLEYQDESRKECENAGIDTNKLNQELDDHLMANVAGGGIISTPGVLLGGAALTVANAGLGAVVGGTCGFLAGLPSGPGAVLMGIGGALGGAVTGGGSTACATLAAAGASLFSLF